MMGGIAHKRLQRAGARKKKEGKTAAILAYMSRILIGESAIWQKSFPTALKIEKKNS